MIGLKNLIKDSTANIRSKIDEIRLQIEQHRQRIDDLQHGRIPKEDAIQRLHDWVDHQANKFIGHEVFGDLYIGSESNPNNAKLEIHSRTNFFADGGNANGEDPRLMATSADSTNLTPMMCFLLGEQIKSRLTFFIEAQDIPDDCPTLSVRPKMIESLHAKINKLEVEEEKLIVECENEGIEIARHPNADPRVILEFKD